MKKILTILFLLTTFVSYTQNQDSTIICMPYEVGRQILIDLNEGDKNKELLEVSQKEIKLLNNKIVEKDSIIRDLKTDVKLCDSITEKTKEKFEIVNEENKILREDITKLKVKNTIFNIVGGAIIGGLTYIILVK